MMLNIIHLTELHIACILMMLILYRKHMQETGMDNRWFAFKRFLQANIGFVGISYANSLIQTLVRSAFVRTICRSWFSIGILLLVCCWAEMFYDLFPGQFLSRKKRILPLSPVLVMIALMLINPITHLAFHYDTKGMLHFGALYFPGIIAIIVFYIIGMERCLLLYWERRNTQDASMTDIQGYAHQIIIYGVAYILGYILESTFRGMHLLMITLTTAMVLMSLDTVRSQISRDNLTGVHTRQNLMEMIRYRIHNRRDQLYLMMIDVNYFKQINDRYGHVMGDLALKRVAAVLKLACGSSDVQAYVARYGGDEFIILGEARNRFAMNALEEDIHASLKQKNEEDGRMTELTVSVGYVPYDAGEMKTPQEFIDAADKLLYEKKKARKGAG